MAAASRLRPKTGVLPLRAHLNLCSQQFYASALQPMHLSHLIVTSLPNPHLLRATLQASYHRILRGLRLRGDDPNAPPFIFGGVLEEGAYPLARRLLRGQMIEDVVRSQASNKVLLATPPPIDPTKQLLPLSYCSALSQLRSGYFSRLQSYCYSCADDPTCPDCRSTDHTLAHLFSCHTHPTDLAPENMWVAPIQVAQFLAELPQFCDLPPLQIDFDSFPSLPSLALLAPSSWASSWSASSSSRPSPRLIISPVVRRSSPPPISNSNRRS